MAKVACDLGWIVWSLCDVPCCRKPRETQGAPERKQEHDTSTACAHRVPADGPTSPASPIDTTACASNGRAPRSWALNARHKRLDRRCANWYAPIRLARRGAYPELGRGSTLSLRDVTWHDARVIRFEVANCAHQSSLARRLLPKGMCYLRRLQLHDRHPNLGTFPEA